MGTDALHDLTAAYALDALDARDRREYEDHLAHCERCRHELGSLSETATTLAYAVGGPAPPASLRQRILDAAHAERPNVVPLRPRWAVPAALTAAAAIAATVALAIWAASLSSRVDSLQAQRDRQQRITAVLASAGRRTYGFGGSGELVVAPNGQGVLVLDRLAPAPAGMTYEAWVAAGGAPKPAGTFQTSSGSTAVPLEARVPAGAKVMITRERAGGTSAPTQAPLIAAST
jgi:hypothetical protein